MSNIKQVEVVYEDNHLIAVIKSAGILVQGDESGERCLMDDVKAYLKETYQKPGNVFLGLIHRLDRNVSGIVLFAKTSKGASRLSEQFRSHSTKKIYHALVEGRLESKKGMLTDRLDKDERKMMAVVSPNGKEAVLTYEVVNISDKGTLVRIELQTGRFHQIRAQFAHFGHPVVGDIKYGAHSPLPNQALALAATELVFHTAVGSEEIRLQIPIPNWL